MFNNECKNDISSYFATLYEEEYKVEGDNKLVAMALVCLQCPNPNSKTKENWVLSKDVYEKVYEELGVENGDNIAKIVFICADPDYPKPGTFLFSKIREQLKKLKKTHIFLTQADILTENNKFDELNTKKVKQWYSDRGFQTFKNPELQEVNTGTDVYEKPMYLKLTS